MTARSYSTTEIPFIEAKVAKLNSSKSENEGFILVLDQKEGSSGPRSLSDFLLVP